MFRATPSQLRNIAPVLASLADSRLSWPLPAKAVGISEVQHPSHLPARRVARPLRPLLLLLQKAQPMIFLRRLLWSMRRHEDPLLLQPLLLLGV